MLQNRKYIRMSEIEPQKVNWLWHPYIPAGKITIIQGDPGEGKTTFALTLAALLSKGSTLPNDETERQPIVTIYQTAEDGYEDTIRPRLDIAGANCDNIVGINESTAQLTLLDARIRETILETNAKLLILDPLQAYLGGEIDMHRANAVRPVFSRLGQVANETGCAVIVVGHMNKMQGSKAMYRGLGSMDISAVARSILVIGRSTADPERRIMAHLKSSLAPFGKSLCFRIDDGLEFIGSCDITAEQLVSGGGMIDNFQPDTKQALAEEKLLELLSEGEVASMDIYDFFEGIGISKRTVENAKKKVGALSVKRKNRFYFSLPQVDD